MTVLMRKIGSDYQDVNDNEFKAMDDRRARSEKIKMEKEVEAGSEKLLTGSRYPMMQWLTSQTPSALQTS